MEKLLANGDGDYSEERVNRIIEVMDAMLLLEKDVPYTRLPERQVGNAILRTVPTQGQSLDFHVTQFAGPHNSN